MAERRGVLASLVDIMIPGDGVWPAASSLGVHLTVQERVNKSILERLAKDLDCGSEGLGSAQREQRERAVRDFEFRHHYAFEALYVAATFAYYEAPEVIAVIVSKGHSYQQVPHLSGYSMPAYDTASDRPQHVRGRYVSTEQIRRLDISALGLPQ